VLAPDALLLLGFGPRLPQAVHDLAQGVGTLKAS
jgi:ABC-type hemin transport system substrate-binding protein